MKLAEWQKLTAATMSGHEWQAWVTGFLARYDAMDRALVAKGFPPTSPLWRAEIERFLRARRRRWVVRAGRRAGKSSTMCRLAVAWAVAGLWYVPPGDVGVVSFVSIDRTEATARIRTIASILTSISVPFEQRAEEVELKNSPVVFRVSTCSVNSVGYTSILIFADECARWESRDSMANPAREVIASQMPTLATQPFGFLVASSSPWSVDDFHAEMFALGDTDFQLVSAGATWLFNPTLTEAGTRLDQPDERIWLREYAAIPSSSVAAAFDADLVLHAMTPRMPLGKHVASWIAIDPSSPSAGGKHDGFGVVAGYVTDQDEVAMCAGGELSGELGIRKIVDSIVALSSAMGVRTIFSDQRESSTLGEILSQHGLTLIPYNWTEGSKQEAVAIVNRWIEERRLIVVPPVAGTVQSTAQEGGFDRLRRELLQIKARMMPSGRIQYNTSGLDVASCIVTLAHAAIKGDFKVGAPVNALYAQLGAMAERGEFGGSYAAHASARLSGTGYDVLEQHPLSHLFDR
ncbi:MAG: hypothetical protein WDO69_05590 [Pseudomonadota bacterium]